MTPLFSATNTRPSGENTRFVGCTSPEKITCSEKPVGRVVAASAGVPDVMTEPATGKASAKLSADDSATRRERDMWTPRASARTARKRKGGWPIEYTATERFMPSGTRRRSLADRFAL